MKHSDLKNELKAIDPNFIPYAPSPIYPANNELTQKPLSSIVRKKIEWLWDKRIALGKVTIFAGEPGKGKSQLLLWIAAAVSNGATMPVDGSVFPKGKVAILSAEDDEDDTICPRLCAVGADLTSIFQFYSHPQINENGELQDDMVNLDQDIQRLDNTFANNPGYKLLIIDPITAYLGNINDHRNAEIRALITKISRIAKKHNIAVILNTHLSKSVGDGKDGSVMNRVIGSIAYVAAARAAYLICDESTENRRTKLFLPMKNNLGDDITGFAYQIKSAIVDEIITTSCIEWNKEPVTISANEVMSKQRTPKLNEAEEFLRVRLKQTPQLLKTLRDQADELKISIGRLYAAKESLGVIEDITVDKPRLTIWTLPK